MTEMEVVYIDNHVVLTITTGSVRGASTATLIHLPPAQRQQLIKALQHPKPYQPKDNNNPSIVI